jgi:predicted porin
MKKSLIALAVAGAFAAPAFAATSNVDVYGTVRMSVDYNDPASPAESNWTVNDRVSRIGFKGSEDLGGGMKGVWQIEQQINAANAPLTADTAFGGAGLRNTFVGLSGGFGTVLVGRHDTPYKLGGSADLFADTAADAQQASGIIGSGNFDLRINGTIAYVSPDFSGFHAAIAVVPGEQSAAGTNANDFADAYSLVAVYVNGPLNASLAFEDHNDLVDESAWKANVGYTFGDLKVGATYEAQKDVSGTSGRDKTAWLVSAAYGMGPITLMAQYGDRNDDLNTNDLTRWTVGAGYALSKRTNVYAAYNSDELNNADSSTVTMGINHSF